MILITTNKDYLLLVDETSRTWGKVAYNPESKDVEFICSHPKYSEEGQEIIAHLPLGKADILVGIAELAYVGLITTDGIITEETQYSFCTGVNTKGVKKWWKKSHLTIMLGLAERNTYSLSKNDLFKIYNSGFNHGSNERGGFPEHGLLDCFNATIEGKPLPYDPKSSYSIKSASPEVKLPIDFEPAEKSMEDIQKELGILGHDEGLTEKEYQKYIKTHSTLKVVDNVVQGTYKY